MDKDQKKKQQDCQFEEMEKMEEFSAADFAKGVAVGVAIGAVVVLT
jgi:hypothetical protein